MNERVRVSEAFVRGGCRRLSPIVIMYIAQLFVEALRPLLMGHE